MINTSEPIRVAEMLRLEIHRAHPSAKIESVGTGDVVLTGPFRLIRFASVLVSALGVVALTLSMIGLYGVLSLSVAQRSREIGIRSALGASSNTLILHFVREGLTPVLQGLLLGLGVGTLVRLMLITIPGWGIAILEPWSMLLVTGLLGVAGTAASYGPARRAASVNPSVVLQEL